VPSPATVAGLLGLPVAELEDTTLLRTSARVQSLRFTLALLRDRFESDCDLALWLDDPRRELGGLSPREALLSGRCAEVEELAMAEWQRVLMETQGVLSS
jgi:hypothetical protein